MSIQARLLLIYTFIFTTAFLLVALLIYFLPRNRILAQTDRELEAIALEVSKTPIRGSGDTNYLSVPASSANFKSATIFIKIIDPQGEIIAQSRNMAGIDVILDPKSLGMEKHFSLVSHDGSALRVLTVPVVEAREGEQVIRGYLQVARLMDSYDEFSRLLTVALLVGFGTATASLFLAVLVTPSLFKPLDDIAAVARQITRADDLSRRAPDTGRKDEIGDLARAFNQTLEQLEKFFQSQQRLLADVSHELRTPLTTIRGNLDLMRRMGVADPESMDIIEEEIERMTRLVGDLLLLARADSGGLPLEYKPVELDNVLFEVARQVSRVEKKVEVRVTEVDQVCVLGDMDRLKQLLLILVDNAIKYTPAGGSISLSLAQTNGWAHLSVTDTGVGIPLEDIPYIFERFYRVDKARSRAQGGSGLGLAIAKWIVQAHGGDIRVKSTVGQGTTFSVALPVRESPQPQTEEPAGTTWSSRSSLRMRRRRSS